MAQESSGRRACTIILIVVIVLVVIGLIAGLIYYLATLDPSPSSSRGYVTHSRPVVVVRPYYRPRPVYYRRVYYGRGR